MLALSRRRSLLIVILIMLALVPSLALAANGLVSIVPEGYNCNGSGGCNSVCALAALAQNVLNDAIFIAVFLSAGLFAYAGFKMLISPANQSEFGKARTLFYNVLMGFIIILAAWLVVNAIMSLLVTGSAGLPWNSIC